MGAPDQKGGKKGIIIGGSFPCLPEGPLSLLLSFTTARGLPLKFSAFAAPLGTWRVHMEVGTGPSDHRGPAVLLCTSG